MRRESFFATMSLSFMKPMRKRGKEGYKVTRFHKVSFINFYLATSDEFELEFSGSCEPEL